MTLYYKSFERDNYFYIIDISFSEYKLSLLPMIYLELSLNNGFEIKIGFLTLIIDFQRLHKMPMEKIKKLFNDISKDIL